MFESLGLESRLKNILLYALGMTDGGDITSQEFFGRIAKYLRSIGYYGDSPFMMCNYGSSEYAQAFSRIGSLYGCVYIVNRELEIQEIFTNENKVEKIEINYNDDPVLVDKGVITGFHYRD